MEFVLFNIFATIITIGLSLIPQNPPPILPSGVVPTLTIEQTPSPSQIEPTYVPLPPKDITPPKVYILTPENNSRINGGMVQITANVTDDVKVDRVEFFIGPENTPIATLTTPPYNYNWDTSRYMNGRNIPLEVRAYDSSGNRSSQTTWVDPQR